MSSAAALSKTLAGIAWLMLVAAHVLHSPLSHHHGEGGCCSSAAGQHSDSHCGHSHSHAHHVGHHHGHENEEPEDKNSKSPSGPQLTHDCELCQFLAQGVTPLSSPVLQEAGWLISSLREAVPPQWRSHRAVTPPVRGPPVTV